MKEEIVIREEMFNFIKDQIPDKKHDGVTICLLDVVNHLNEKGYDIDKYKEVILDFWNNKVVACK